MDTGGAPIFNSDLIRLQQNAGADFINSAEQYRRLLPPVMYYAGPGNPTVKNYENGLILSGFTYTYNSPASSTIAPGFYLSGGEVCYYAGGTYTTGISTTLVYIKKALPQFTSRTFNDGISKQFTETYGSDVDVSEVGVNGPVMPLMAIAPTDEIIVVSIGNNGPVRYAETYFTKEAALGINTLAARLYSGPWGQATTTPSSAAFTSFVTNRGSFLVSRVDKDGFTHIHGAVKFSGSAANEHDVKLSESAFNHSGVIGVPCMVNVDGNALYFPAMASVFANGVIRFRAEFNGLATNNFVLPAIYYFDCKIMGSVPAAFEMPRDFLDVTP
jgi:hypothetical protein